MKLGLHRIKRRMLGAPDEKLLALPLALEEGKAPRVASLILMVVSLFVGIAIVWASVTTVRELAVAAGQVEPAGSVLTVKHLEGGIVGDIVVGNGALVEAGDPLVQFQPALAGADLDQARAKAATLELTAIRQEAFASEQEPVFEVSPEFRHLANAQMEAWVLQNASRTEQRGVAGSRIAQRKAELTSLERRVANLETQVDILEEQMEMRRGLLEKGLVSRIAFLESQRAVEQTRGELITTQGRVTEVEQALLEAELSLKEINARLLDEAKRDRARALGELEEVRNQIAKARDRVKRLAVRAPARGIVKGLTVNSVGDVVRPGDPVLEIVPLDDELVAKVDVDPKDIGHVSIGDRAQVRITTYDPARFGVLEGSVSKISASTFEDERGEHFYHATITLDRNYVGSDMAKHLVLPGMIVNAEIVTGSKSIVRYLLKPVFRSLDTAFSER
ncbi:MAG: HlyD family type I secretion periplasmic adaptor subunit [Candidatus Phaeomarinobacter sp.]